MSEPIAMTSVQDWPVYGFSKAEKTPLLLKELVRLTRFHDGACPAYRNVLEKVVHRSNAGTLDELPFLPVRLFKHEKLLSIPPSEVIKTMTSSGTSGQSVSQIFLDKKTSAMQVKVLSRIIADYLGPRRLPMLVIDCRATVADRYRFSARTAGILGFSIFGREVEFALDDDMSLNIERVQRFMEKYSGQDVLMFGFTFMIWQHLVTQLERIGRTLPIERGILIHGGGWKQLQSQAVDTHEFKQRLRAATGVSRVHNYYGMVEQTGSIFMECEAGHLHTSVWSEIIIRDAVSFSPMPVGQRGLIQLMSVIPHSYPGHSLLSEDEGEILGNDDCPCGRKGTYFKVHGRIQNAETRGCSDTYS